MTSSPISIDREFNSLSNGVGFGCLGATYAIFDSAYAPGPGILDPALGPPTQNSISPKVLSSLGESPTIFIFVIRPRILE